MTCEECIHKSVCYRVDSVQSNYARKCGDFVNGDLSMGQGPKTEKVIKMRDTTPEERESVDKYIKSISKPTGVNFWDLEQEPKTDVLDKIRAEIEEVVNENKAIDSNNSRAQNIGLMWVLQIIDKYKGEET